VTAAILEIVAVALYVAGAALVLRTLDEGRLSGEPTGGIILASMLWPALLVGALVMGVVDAAAGWAARGRRL
jgi:hypothetical protein